MNSSPVLDALPAPIATAPNVRSLPEKETQPFGAILEEATEASDEADDLDAETSDVDAPAEPAEKKKEDTAAVLPLFCFCPPPKIDAQIPTAPAPTAQNVASIPETAGEAKAAAIDQPALSSDSLIHAVTPKEGVEQTSSGAIKLDPKLFQTVAPETASAEIQLAKAPEPQPPPATDAPHGTLVAQLENRVKNSEKSAEFAPAPEQKMPVKGDLRRAVVELGRVESFHAENKPSHALSADFAPESREVIPVKSIQAVHLVESIRTEVATLRQRGDNTMTVVLRPDSGTQLSVNLSIARDGSVHAQARCERGDFQTLQAQWPQLQQSLATHGIRIADLSNQNSPQQQNHGSATAFQNPERGQNQQQRSDAEAASFEDQFKVSKQKFSSTKPQPQPPAPAASPTRRWQSWA